MVVGNNITLILDHKKILDDVSFELPKGRITAFIGRSGAGKTSLLKSIATIYRGYEGTISCQGKEMRTFNPQERAHTVGFVFQNFNLFPNMTVLGNCIHPMMTVLRVTEAQASYKAEEILTILGLIKYKNAYPKQLSGGQQQRAAIARALCMGPQVLLFDEPTSALDPYSSAAFATLLKDLRDAGYAIGVSSHDMPFVRSIMDRVYFMKDGRITDTYDITQDILKSESDINMFLMHA